jgi:hypothetical protein
VSGCTGGWHGAALSWGWPLTDRLRPGAALLVLACLLAACTGDPGADRLQDYVARVARPLGSAIPEPAPRVAETLPRWTALQQSVEPGSLDGLDFLKLRGCALQQTVARRNSSLGRLAPPSQRLLLELAFLRQVAPCEVLLRDRGEKALAQLLREAALHKQRQLPRLVFNATLGSEEFREFWRSANHLGAYPADTSSAVVAALEGLENDAARWLDGDYRADDAALELRLAAIAAGDGGELLRALGRQAAYLDAATALLRERSEQGSLCPGGRQPQAAQILRTVTRKYFVGSVQRHAAALEQRRHQLLPPLRRLESRLGRALPSAYSIWRSAREERLAGWQRAPKRHVLALQALLGDCFSEFAPGPS